MLLQQDKTLIAYQRIREVSKYYQIPEQSLQKPCIANLLSGDGGASRNISGLILVTELVKTGLEKEKIEAILRKWNTEKLDPSLSEAKIRRILTSGFAVDSLGKPKYDYGCNNSLQVFCLPEGKEACIYYQNYIKAKEISEPSYISLKWQHVLTPREYSIIAHFIPYLEGKRHYKKGARIFVSVRELEAITGINKRFITGILKSLSDYGLIEYRAGIGRNWEKKASEIKRIIPPPKIPEEYSEDIPALKEYKKLHKKLKKGVLING